MQVPEPVFEFFRVNFRLVIPDEDIVSNDRCLQQRKDANAVHSFFLFDKWTAVDLHHDLNA